MRSLRALALTIAAFAIGIAGGTAGAAPTAAASASGGAGAGGGGGGGAGAGAGGGAGGGASASASAGASASASANASAGAGAGAGASASASASTSSSAPLPETCSELVPTGAARPQLLERLPTRARAGDLLELEVVVRHLAGETATLPSQAPSELTKGPVRIATERDFLKSAPPPSVVDPTDPSHANTILKLPLVILSNETARTPFTIPALRVVVLRKGGGDVVVCTKPHVVEIDQPIANTPDPKVRPNPPTLPQITRDERAYSIAQWSVGALALGVALASLFFWWIRRPKPAAPPPPPPKPWVIALERLRTARDRFAIGALPTKPYYDALSDALREYFGRLYGFDGLELTTDEIVARLRRVPSVSLPFHDVVSFLGACDLVKFAGHEPDAETAASAARAAMDIVQATAPFGGGGQLDTTEKAS